MYCALSNDKRQIELQFAPDDLTVSSIALDILSLIGADVTGRH